MSMRRPPAVPTDDVIDVATDIGPLLMHAGDAVMTPIIASRGAWEPEESAWLRRVLAAGMTFVDAGANVGYFSLLGAAAVGPSGTVFAVEPEPRNLALLRANLWRAGADHVHVLPIAAHDRRALLTLRLSEENRGDHRVGMPDEDGGLLVPAGPLDDELHADCVVDVAKIDTQGSELQVLQGMAGILDRSPGLRIVCEFWPDGLRERGDDPVAVLSDYGDLGLGLALLAAGGETSAATADEVLAAIPAEGFVNLVLARN